MHRLIQDGKFPSHLRAAKDSERLGFLQWPMKPISKIVGRLRINPRALEKRRPAIHSPVCCLRADSTAHWNAERHRTRTKDGLRRPAQRSGRRNARHDDLWQRQQLVLVVEKVELQLHNNVVNDSEDGFGSSFLLHDHQQVTCMMALVNELLPRESAMMKALEELTWCLCAIFVVQNDIDDLLDMIGDESEPAAVVHPRSLSSKEPSSSSLLSSSSKKDEFQVGGKKK